MDGSDEEEGAEGQRGDTGQGAMVGGTGDYDEDEEEGDVHRMVEKVHGEEEEDEHYERVSWRGEGVGQGPCFVWCCSSHTSVTCKRAFAMYRYIGLRMAQIHYHALFWHSWRIELAVRRSRADHGEPAPLAAVLE